MMNNKSNNSIYKKLATRSLALLFAFGMVSCTDDDDNPMEVLEEEVITTMNVTLTANGSTVTLQSKDLDADGPNAPETTITGNFLANTTYTGSIELLNETVTPIEDVTEEIEEKKEEHQFFFTTTGSVDNVTYNDEDADNNPIGLSFTLTTGDSGSGSIQITLRHEPKKPNDGSLADAGGETDIAQTFTITVQ